MKFTDSHEWVDISGNIATVGVSEHAQKELGEVVYAELPRVGNHIKASEEAVVLESTKAAVDIYSPMSGEIIEINPSLKESPSLINQSPESKGWLYRLKISNPEEYEMLMSEKDYRSYLTD